MVLDVWTSNWDVNSGRGRLGATGYVLSWCLEIFELTPVADQVRWFRNRAAVERCQEEKELLEVEILRVLVSIESMSQTWTQLSTTTSNAGRAAYAHKQADMY